MESERYRRRQYFIKPDLQTKYAFMFVLSIGIGLNLGVILALLAPQIKEASGLFTVMYGLLALAIVVLVAGISIMFTHRIAGPIYKIERSFRQIMDEKDLTVRVFLRTGDEMQELADEINRLLDHLSKTVMIEQQKLDAILAKLDHLNSELSNGDSPDKSALLEQLNSIRDRIEDSGLKYKLQ